MPLLLPIGESLRTLASKAWLRLRADSGRPQTQCTHDITECTHDNAKRLISCGALDRATTPLFTARPFPSLSNSFVSALALLPRFVPRCWLNVVTNSLCIEKKQTHCHYRQKQPTKAQLKAPAAPEQKASSGAKRPVRPALLGPGGDMVATPYGRTSGLSSALSLKRCAKAECFSSGSRTDPKRTGIARVG